MSKESRDRRVFGLLCLAVSIVAVSFAYTSFTHTLKIKATEEDEGIYWGISFENLSKAVKSGSAIEKSTPVIDNYLRIFNYEVIFYTPGDCITYYVDVVNEGKADAELSNISISNPTCIGEENDCKNTLKNVKHILTYDDGSTIKVGDLLYAKSDDSSKLYKRKLKLTITYSKDIKQSELPSNDVLLTGMDAVLIYIEKNM